MLQAAERVNGPCRIAGQTVSVGGKDLACVRSGKKLRWKAMPQRKVPPLSISPSPSSSPRSSPTPTPTPTRILSIAERWDEIDSTALQVARPLMEVSLAEKHSVEFLWKSSERANPEVLTEIKRRYELAARFWEPYVKVSNPILVLLGNLNEHEWICDEKLKWFAPNWYQPDCVQMQKRGGDNNTMAGQSQTATKNLDVYLVDTRARLDTVGFMARIEHEFTHNVFHAMAKNYHGAMPCWMMESGAEYFGILSSSGKDLSRFIALRNASVTKPRSSQVSMEGASLDKWQEFLVRTDRTEESGSKVGVDTCSPVRGEIYTYAVLANEFLVAKLGVKGYLELVKLAGKENWALAVEETFNKSLSVLYREMAEYMKYQFDLMIKHPFAQQSLPRDEANLA